MNRTAPAADATTAAAPPAGDALALARRALITHRFPLFATCWLGTTVLWSAVLVSEGRLGPRGVSTTLALQCALLVGTQLLFRVPGAERWLVPLVGGACVLLGVSSTAMFAAAGGSGDVLAFVLLTLYVAAALFFGWGWRPQVALWLATVIGWLAAAPFLVFAVPSLELATAIVIGSALSWAIAEGMSRTFRSAWIHRAAEARIRADLERSRDAAEAATRAKDEFLATLSHELRSPLTAILAWTQLLRRGRLDATRAARALDVIERNTRLQARLIEDLLDVSRVAAGKLRVELTRLDVREIVRATTDSCRGAADARRIALVLELAVAPLPVRADPVRLQQILANLVDNALKFTPEGGRVVVRGAAVGGAVEVAVEDTGIGMSPDVLGRAFERFHQADSSIVRRQGGLGLGLAIARHLVALHGGTIEAESGGLGRGSTFRVRLPLDVGTSAAEHAVGGDPSAARLPSLAGLRIMVVDDEADTREFFTSLLASCGATVTTAASVAEAMRAASERLPDVLVADLAMPVEDGFALIRRLRGAEPAGGARIRAIAISALAGSEDRSRAMRAGFDVHLAKPVEPDVVVAAVAGDARARSGARAAGDAANGHANGTAQR